MQAKQRNFSVEIQTKTSLKTIQMTEGTHENVLIEGALGELVAASFEEDIVLQVVGTKGTLRVDLARNEVAAARPQTKKA